MEKTWYEALTDLEAPIVFGAVCVRADGRLFLMSETALRGAKCIDTGSGGWGGIEERWLGEKEETVAEMFEFPNKIIWGDVCLSGIVLEEDGLSRLRFQVRHDNKTEPLISDRIDFNDPNA